MSIKQLFSVAGLAVCSIALAANQQTANEPKAAAGTPAELQKQLVAAADEGQRLARESYRAGQGTAEESLMWTRRSLDARLTAATTKADRIAILAEAVKVAKQQEADAMGRQRAGIIRATDVVAARYSRIEAELALATEEAK